MGVHIVVGPRQRDREDLVDTGQAPRLDYLEVARSARASIMYCHASPSGLRGPKGTKVLRSAFCNTLDAARLESGMDDDSVVFSTGETWGLPVASIGALQRLRRFRHVMYCHRIYSDRWLAFFRSVGNRLPIDTVLCETSRQAEALRGPLGERIQVSIVPQAVDRQFYDPELAQPSNHDPYILCVGAEMRDFDLLFAAVASLRVRVIVKASSAWMTGPRRPLGQAPKSVSVISGQLSYPEMRNLYAGASLVTIPLQPTLQAAGITAIFEAMSMAKCVVATRTPGLPDQLVSTENGLIVDPDPDILRSTLAWCLGNPSSCADLGRVARVSTSKVSFEAYVSGILNALDCR